MDRHNRDSGIAPEVKPELPEEAEEIVLSSDSENSAEDPVPGGEEVPGGEVLPGGFMDENIEIPVLQHIPEGDNQEDNQEAQQQPPPQKRTTSQRTTRQRTTSRA